MPDDRPLAGRTIGITADRRWREQAELFERRGAVVIHGPSLRTADLRADEGLRAVTVGLIEAPPDWLVATTGFGVRLWFEAATEWGLLDGLLGALARSRVVARGPKSRSALRQAGLDPEWSAPGESMDEVVGHVEGAVEPGARVAVQLFDPDDHPATVRLRAVVGELIEIPLYRWLLPDDPTLVDRLIDGVIERRVDAVTFTSQPAVRFLFRRAGERRGPLRDAFNADVLPVCIGPVCAEAAVDCGIDAARLVWPDPFRLVPMVKLVERRLGGAGA